MRARAPKPRRRSRAPARAWPRARRRAARRAALAQAQQELIARRHYRGWRHVAQEFEAHEAEVRFGEEAVNAAAFAVQAAAAELQRAQTRLAPSTPASGRRRDDHAPADGVCSSRLRESERIVPAGEPLLEIGDPRQLEIVADLLSTDAVRVKPGAARDDRAMGRRHGAGCHGPPRRACGFTKISALGVEEQRVNVILDFDDWHSVRGPWRRLSGRGTHRHLGPATSSRCRPARSFAMADGGRCTWSRGRAQHVRRAGTSNRREAEVTSGLAEGVQVIVHPGDSLADGARVRASASQ